MRISDWSSDVCSSDLSFLKRHAIFEQLWQLKHFHLGGFPRSKTFSSLSPPSLLLLQLFRLPLLAPLLLGRFTHSYPSCCVKPTADCMTPSFLDSLEPLSESEVEVCQLSPMQEDFPLTRPRKSVV